MKTVLCLVTLMIAACVTTSRVVPIGKDTYMVSASNDACGNCSNPPQIRAAEEANAYCAKLGKMMVAQNSEAQTFDIGFGHKITLTFQCVDK